MSDSAVSASLQLGSYTAIVIWRGQRKHQRSLMAESQQLRELPLPGAYGDRRNTMRYEHDLHDSVAVTTSKHRSSPVQEGYSGSLWLQTAVA